MKMKRLVLMMAALGFFAGSAHADFAADRAGALGLGVGMGQPIGVTGKFWFSNLVAVDAMAGYHIDDNFDIHSDVLLHAYPFPQVSNGQFPIYIGLGGRILAGDDTQFGIRIPVGVSYLYNPGHLEFFAEIAPVIRLNDVKGSIDGLVGLRIYRF